MATSYREYLLEMQERHHCIGPPFKEATEEELLELEIRRLLEWLYDPSPSYVGWQCGQRAVDLGLLDDAINWGDLSASVEECGEGHFEVRVEEASPAAHRLQQWLTDRLNTWGWTNVRVYTEW